MMIPFLAQNRPMPAIGSKVAYSVTYRSGGTERTNTREMEVVGYDGGVVELHREGYGTILADWPEWWQDGTCAEAAREGGTDAK